MLARASQEIEVQVPARRTVTNSSSGGERDERVLGVPLLGLSGEFETLRPEVVLAGGPRG